MVEAVRLFRGRVEWDMQPSGEQWIILPRHVYLLARQNNVPIRKQSKAVGTEDPAFGLAANADIPALGEHVLTTLKQRGLISDLAALGPARRERGR